MRIITVASQKGGSGKTTLAGHLAVEAERSGSGPVAIIDTDPQGSLAAWWNTREAPTPLFAAVNVQQLGEQLARLREDGIACVIIDTPPELLDVIRATITAADFVLIPARPSPHDLRAVGVVVEMAEEALKPFCFVVNGAIPRSTIAQQAVGSLAEHGKVAPVMVHHRVDFAASMIDGRTVEELMPDSRAAQEVAALWKYGLKQVRKYTKK